MAVSGALVGNRLPPGRSLLRVVVLLLSVLALLPLLALAAFALTGAGGDALALGPAGRLQLTNTVLLLIGVGLGGAALGTANGWLTASCRFPGRRWLRIAQLLPLATPAYLLAATLIDLGSRAGLRIHGPLWSVAVLTLSTYTYVFLLSTESFAVTGSRPGGLPQPRGWALGQLRPGGPADGPAGDRCRYRPHGHGGGQ